MTLILVFIKMLIALSPKISIQISDLTFNIIPTFEKKQKFSDMSGTVRFKVHRILMKRLDYGRLFLYPNDKNHFYSCLGSWIFFLAPVPFLSSLYHRRLLIPDKNKYPL